jgi:hypothetical protein
MTEAEWMSCDDPTRMLEFLRGKASDRKLRLFAVACCRRIWQFLTVEALHSAEEIAQRYADGTASQVDLKAADAVTVGALHSAVEIAERYADDRASYEDIRGANKIITEIAKVAFFHGIHLTERGGQNPFVFQHAAMTVAESTSASLDTPLGDHDPALGECAASVAAESTHPQNKEIYKAERERQAYLARDILGNPFRPVAVAQSWLAWNDGAVRKLAQAVYDDRAFDRLPLLADALGSVEQSVFPGHNRATKEAIIQKAK